MKHQRDAAVPYGLSRHDRRPHRNTPFPHIACEFQPRRFGNHFGGGDWPPRRPGLSQLAREVLRADASRNFKTETAVLALVSLACAWPMAIMIHEVYLIMR